MILLGGKKKGKKPVLGWGWDESKSKRDRHRKTRNPYVGFT